MLVITGFFNDEDRFIPDKPIKVPQNMKVKLTIEEEKYKFSKEASQEGNSKAWEDFFNELEKIEDEDLPDDFYLPRLQFKTPEELGL